MAWFETRTPQERSVMASRAALRVMANISRFVDGSVETLALPVFWATLISAVRGSGRTADMDGDAATLSATLSAYSAADSADSATLSARSAADSADSAARSAYSAAYSAARSADAATRSAADSADSAALSATADDAERVTSEDTQPGVWGDVAVPGAIADNHATFLQILNQPSWPRFFHDWYLAMWEGTWEDWDLAHAVASLPAETWNAGLEAVAAAIEQIEKGENETGSGKQPKQSEIDLVRRQVTGNRDAIALSAASLIEQIGDFRERVRGLNHLEPDFRDGLLGYLDNLSNHLEQLIEKLPVEGEEISDAKASALVQWYREFKPLALQKAKVYASPDNISDATLPTGIILTSTLVGTLLGGPAGGGVGALVGGLITSQVKPGKAAEELLKDHDNGASS